jgi:hypothetical protein
MDRKEVSAESAEPKALIVPAPFSLVERSRIDPLDHKAFRELMLTRPWQEARKLEHRKRIQTGRAYGLLNSARYRAAKKGTPFTLTFEWAFYRLWAGWCEITGLQFRWTGILGVRSNFAPSIDPKVPALGYTPENSRMVVWGYNAAKGVGTDEEVMRIAEALVWQKAQKNGPPGP